MAGITEAIATALFCTLAQGEIEARHDYEHGYIRVDCETANHVIEAGLDKRSSLDSAQQVVFAAILTNKIPVVIIYDTDGIEGKYEYRIRKTCEYLGIDYYNPNVTQWIK